MALARPGTLRAQLALLTFGGVLVATAFVAWEAWSTRRLLRERALAETRQLASQTAQAVQEGLGSAQELVVSFSEWPATRALGAGDCSAYAARLLAASPRYANIGAADTTGRVFCSGTPLRQPASFAAEPWFGSVEDCPPASLTKVPFPSRMFMNRSLPATLTGICCVAPTWSSRSPSSPE